VWVSGDEKGPNRIGKNTGAGVMDAALAWDSLSAATDKTKVDLAVIYTRSDNEANGNDSYLQGGVAFATLTAKGVVPGIEVALPRLNGERTFMRPEVGFLPNNRALLMAASEDNGVNNNPTPVAFVISRTDGRTLTIPNSTRGAANINKPTNLILTATQQGLVFANPNTGTRGPHTIQQVNENTFVVGMQYNNQAQEAYSITVTDDNSIHMNWLVRYSDTAQHCRPQVAIAPAARTGYIAAVEANQQPADIGIRVTEFDVATGRPLQSKIVVRSQPTQNRYVSEPVMGLMGDKLALTYGIGAQVRNGANNNNQNGHAGGKKIDAAVLLDKADLSVIGQPIVGVGQYGRHGSSFVTGYGPNADPALAVISGSSTGTGAGFIQMFPLKSDGSLGIKDAAKVYQVSPFSDVANVQTRGKRNPNNQGRGFITGLGNLPNPGFTTDPTLAATNFMPEVKQLSFSTVTGYSGADAMAKGLKNSIWLSLVPAAWQSGLQTMPGKATETPGTNADGTGPAPRSAGQATNPSGDVASGGTSVIGGEATHPSKILDGTTAGSQGCRATSAKSRGDFGLVSLAVAAALALRRRRRAEWIRPA
jgi:MYXO-CTERM domain-containing protein